MHRKRAARCNTTEAVEIVNIIRKVFNKSEMSEPSSCNSSLNIYTLQYQVLECGFQSQVLRIFVRYTKKINEN